MNRVTVDRDFRYCRWAVVADSSRGRKVIELKERPKLILINHWNEPGTKLLELTAIGWKLPRD
jgi:hypothetical protein